MTVMNGASLHYFSPFVFLTLDLGISLSQKSSLGMGTTEIGGEMQVIKSWPHFSLISDQAYLFPGTAFCGAVLILQKINQTKSIT